MDIPGVVIALVALCALWLLALIVQLSDLGGHWHDLRTANAPDAGVRRPRAITALWMLPILTLLTIATMFAVDLATRLLLDAGELAGGILSLLAIAAVALGLALLAARVLRGSDLPNYAAVRAELGTLKGTKVGQDELDELRFEIDVVDARANRLGARGGWFWRAIPVVIAMAAVVLSVVAVASASASWWWIGAVVVATALSVWLDIAGSRLSRRATAAWRTVWARERANTVTELDELERRAKRGSALSDRVSRALQILREQQR